MRQTPTTPVARASVSWLIDALHMRAAADNNASNVVALRRTRLEMKRKQTEVLIIRRYKMTYSSCVEGAPKVCKPTQQGKIARVSPSNMPRGCQVPTNYFCGLHCNAVRAQENGSQESEARQSFSRFRALTGAPALSFYPLTFALKSPATYWAA